MNLKLKQAFQDEMRIAISLYDRNDLKKSFYHFERAHILGQQYVLPHTRSHWWMLKIGARRLDPREIFGQITRILASLLFSKIWVPLGNTGGANVSPIKPMPIPDDLKTILEHAQ